MRAAISSISERSALPARYLCVLRPTQVDAARDRGVFDVFATPPTLQQRVRLSRWKKCMWARTCEILCALRHHFTASKLKRFNTIWPLVAVDFEVKLFQGICKCFSGELQMREFIQASRVPSYLRVCNKGEYTIRVVILSHVSCVVLNDT